MKTKDRKSLRISIFALLLLLLAGCNIVPGVPGVLPRDTETPTVQLSVTGPEAARDITLAYIRTYHPGTGPSEDAFWFDETVPNQELVGSSTFHYRYESWVVTVTFPVVALDATIYTVTFEHTSPQFYWQGLVDAYGQVVETSFSAEEAQPTGSSPTSTPITLPTETPEPTETPTSTPTNTATPVPTSTPIPDPCNAAKFVADVTIQDGTIFTPGTNFTKIWRLKNVGTCTWTTDYDLVFVDGRLMSGDQTQALPGRVKPGESIDVSVDLKAPKDPGDYQGFWMLRDAGGVLFGLGEYANKSFWVSITVVDFDEGSYTYDFALNYCGASWRSENGRLSCPGLSGSADGFVQLLSNPELENRSEDEPTLWVHPNEERYGWIEGTFPTYKVEEGDHFKAWVGCLEGNGRCSLTFYLDYLDAGGRVHRLGEWIETYDGNVTKIDVDLSDLAGESIRFILGVEANTKNVDDAQGFWFVPRID